MPLPAIPRPRPYPIRIALLVLAALALLSAAEAAATQRGRQVAKEAQNVTLGRSVLTTTAGKTLYSLSVETHGRWICTGVCLASWKPLLVANGVKPKGPVRFGSAQRPNGRTQVTYKGLPLYSFNGDVKSGEANGEGLKDVGTWHAARVGTVNPQPTPEAEPPYPY
ncbi:MAG: hypothetical protein ACJ76D_01065 [Solirubrobacterales bacterium]